MCLLSINKIKKFISNIIFCNTRYTGKKYKYENEYDIVSYPLKEFTIDIKNYP
jgi:hypothetical protein